MDRTETALRYFLEGYNCAQSVFAAYCDLWGVSAADGLRLTAGMGGGMGGLREKCGTLSACFLLAGLKYGDYAASDHESKKKLYALIQQMARAFSERFGDTKCSELLKRAKAVFSSIPAKRDAAYYASRPCSKFVEGACEIVERFLVED